MQTVDIFLSQGLPPKLEDISDCPIEPSAYSAFRKQAFKCLLEARTICTPGFRLEIIHWPMVAMLFAHEDSDAPYTSTECAETAADILNNLVIPEQIIEKIFDEIRVKLSPKLWRHYVAEKYILESICKRSPCTKQQLALISNISDSHLPEDQRLAAVCLTSLVDEFNHEDGNQSLANSVLDALLRLTRGRELEVLRPALAGIYRLLFVSRCCHSRRSRVYSHVLRNSALAISTPEKQLYAESLRSFTEAQRFAGREFANMTLDVVESWTTIPAMRHQALLVVLSMLSHGVITDSWKRAAKMLLDCTIASETRDESTSAIILACRNLIQTIRTDQESQSERNVYKKLEVCQL